MTAPDMRTRIRPRQAALAAGLLLLLLLLPRAARALDPAYPTLLQTNAWEQLPAQDWAFPPYARFLAGVRISLDPGHGGDAFLEGYKRGPAGVREAEMNLRIARFLAAFLEQAGAEVHLTRDIDLDYTLAERSAVANRLRSDIFVSLHHNASASPAANHTTVWYHGLPEDSLPGLDLAHELVFAIGEALRTTFLPPNPLFTDYLMYDTGFGVLRQLKVMGALTESSFFTHPAEEMRLADPAYNRREAYGIFLGIARYVAKGLPRAVWLAPADRVAAPCGEIALYLNDGLEDRGGWGHERNYILADSLAVRLDGEPVSFAYDASAKTVTLRPAAPLRPGGHRLEIRFQNLYKHHNIHPVATFSVVDGSCLAGRTICLDPGHGGTGASDPSRVIPETGEHEEQVNLRVALLLASLLERASAEVVLTRREDVEVDLAERARIAVDADADLFVSLHHNGSFDPEIDMPLVFFGHRAPANRESVRFAGMLLEEFQSELGRSDGGLFSDRTIYTNGFAVLRHTLGKMPAAIGEPVFFTNPQGARLLADADYNAAEARAYLNAITAFFDGRAPAAAAPEEEVVPPAWIEEPLPHFTRIAAGEPFPWVWRSHLTLSQAWLHRARQLRQLVLDRDGALLPERESLAQAADGLFRGAVRQLEWSLRYFPNSPRAAGLWDDIAAAHSQMLLDPGAPARAREARLRLVCYYPGTPQAAAAAARLRAPPDAPPADDSR